MWQRLAARRPWQQWQLQCKPGGLFPPFSSQAVLTYQLRSPPSIALGRTSSLDGGRGSEKVSSNTPGARDSALCCPHISGHREARYPISGAPSGLWRKKTGSSQPWECSSCQSGKLNELVMERKMPHHFKARLNPGRLIVPSCSPTPFQAGSHCPMNGPDLAGHTGKVQGRPANGQIRSKTQRREIHVI